MGDVMLVCMPFGPVFSPSIGLSLLKAGLTAQGIASHVRYFSIPFAERIGQHFYCGISRDGRPPNRKLAGEWMFSHALFPGKGDPHGYVEEVLRESGPRRQSSHGPVSPALVGRIVRAAGEVDGFLDWCLAEVLATLPRIVGFTSIFQQHVPSLALAQRIKKARPEIFIVMGGANCEGPMGAETVRQFPFVDAAVSGEADLVFPELVRRVRDGRALHGLAGVRLRQDVDAGVVPERLDTAPMVTPLDQLPYPDYDDYFEQYGRSRYARSWQPSLFFETSRGCWWGEKQHCTFCGLNGTTMAYRSKSAGRALNELVYLTQKHPRCDVQVTDNILDLRYFKDFLPELATRALGVDLLYETKSNLSKDQLRTLRAAGISRIQPGIESLNDVVLRLMRKGVSALQNVQLLKWCRELGIEPYWNVLWGFPGEPPAEYTRMADLVPLLTHLTAPRTFGALRLDRFSPNFFDAERMGFSDVVPLAPYRHIYPLPEAAVANLAYYFDFRYREPRDVDAYVRPLARALFAWKRSGDRSALFSVDLGECLLVWDLRPFPRSRSDRSRAGRPPLTVLRGLDRTLYRAADTASGLAQLTDAAGRGAEIVEERLRSLCARGLMLRDGARWLSLAVPLTEHVLSAAAAQRFIELARSLGTRRGESIVIPLDDPAAHAARPERPRRRRARTSRVPLSASRFSLDACGRLVVSLSATTRGGVDGREEEDDQEAAR